MKKIVMSTGLFWCVALLAFTFAYASGSGSHSHGQHAVEKGSDDSVIIYKDHKDGIDAYLEFYDFKELASSSDKEFIVKCHVKAYLKDSITGENLQPSRLVLRATIGHDQFGETSVFKPLNDNKMQTDLYVKNKGEQHYLLITEIEDIGVKEFHFHHTF